MSKSKIISCSSELFLQQKKEGGEWEDLQPKIRDVEHGRTLAKSLKDDPRIVGSELQLIRREWITTDTVVE